MKDKSEDYSDEKLKIELDYLLYNIPIISENNRKKIKNIFLETIDLSEAKRFEIFAQRYPEKARTVIGDILKDLSINILRIIYGLLSELFSRLF